MTSIKSVQIQFIGIVNSIKAIRINFPAFDFFLEQADS